MNIYTHLFTVVVGFSSALSQKEEIKSFQTSFEDEWQSDKNKLRVPSFGAVMKITVDLLPEDPSCILTKSKVF